MRVLFAGLGCFIALCILISRLFYLQVVSHEHFSTLSLNNRLKIVAAAPPRGLIYDRNGIVLAQNLPSYRLEVTPEAVEDIEDTLVRLGRLLALRETDIERFRRALKRRGDFEAIPLRFNLNDAEVANFSVNRHHFPGVDIAARPGRHYPYAQTAVHVVGYVGRIDENDLKQLDKANYKATTHIGKVGIEKFYEERLHGRVGYQQVEVNAEGRVLRVLDEAVGETVEHTVPEPGENLHLTIDINLQKTAEKALKKYTGSIVAIDPKTGEVLALVSQPSYNPHPFVNGISVEDYAVLRDAESRPLFNRALTGQYPPGSTLKPFIALAALERGVLSAHTKVHCRGFYQLPNDDHKYRDWKKTGHGKMDMKNAIAESCDVYFYDLSQRTGIDLLASYLKLFGLGQRLGIDVFGEKTGLIPSREWKRKVYGVAWYPGETLIAGIGQGYMLTTPLQLAHATAGIAMYGKRYKPHLLRAHGDDVENTPIQYIQPEVLPEVPHQNSGNWDYILESMQEVVHGLRGTARRISYKTPYNIAGKTGTAQVISVAQDEEYDEEKLAEKLRDHALFVGFAPLEDPQIAVAVIAENGGSGGSVAAPMAKKVIDFYLKQQASKNVIQ